MKKGTLSSEKYMKTKDIKFLDKNDIISLEYGTSRINARVVSNSLGKIVWHSLNWLEQDALTSSYYECVVNYKIAYLGTYRTVLRRIFTLNFSRIKYL